MDLDAIADAEVAGELASEEKRALEVAVDSKGEAESETVEVKDTTAHAAAYRLLKNKLVLSEKEKKELRKLADDFGISLPRFVRHLAPDTAPELTYDSFAALDHLFDTVDAHKVAAANSASAADGLMTRRLGDVDALFEQA